MRSRLVLLILVCFSFFSCSNDKREEEKIINYLTLILDESPDISHHYILVSDFGCTPCKEQVYQQIEEKSPQKVYIILLPRNKAVLQERFHDAILENRVFIDFAKINLEKDVILDKAKEILHIEGKWILQDWELNAKF